jgi:prepilin-type N-terminal cleavage/methylation domain-containing protein
MSQRRAGFTFVEILTSMTIIAILAGIVIPKTGDFITRAKAAAAVSDIGNVASAVNAFMASAPADSSHLPPTYAMGLVPDSLKPYLGANYTFVHTDYSLQYNNWSFTQIVNGQRTTQTIIGVTMQAKDARLGQLVMEQLPLLHFQWGQNYTFIVYGL